MKSLNYIASLSSNPINTPNITMCDSRQTTDRKVTESDNTPFGGKVMSHDSLLKYLNSKNSAEIAA